MATKQIKDLDPAAPLAGTEYTAISQTGLTRRATASQIAALGLPAGGTTGQVLAKASSANNDTTWLTSPAMVWRGAWAAGTYKLNEVVRRGPWTSVVTNPTGTSTPPDPQHTGTVTWQIPDAPSWELVSSTAKTVRTTLRINLPGWIKSIRYWNQPVTNITYDVQVTLAAGTDWIRQMTLISGEPSTASADVWIPVSLENPIFVQPGVYVDIARIAHNRTGGTSGTGSYNYSKPGNPVAPASGQILQANNDRGLLRVHKIGANSVDNSTALASLTVGSEISVTDMTWVIQSIADAGTFIDFRVLPATQSGLTGTQTFTFTSFAPAATNYRRLTNYFASNSYIQGLVQVDGGTEAGTEDAYGIDIQFEVANLSPDWQVLAYSATP